MSKFFPAKLYILIGLLIILTGTNRWLSWTDGIEVLSARDVVSYWQLADASPLLLATDIPFHHAQRLSIPYLVGLLATVTSIPVPLAFRIASYSLIALTLGCIYQILQQLRLNGVQYTLVFSLLLLNPYTFRYYLIVPGLIPDLAFNAGLAMAIAGLVRGKFMQVGWGQLLASLGRQTSLMLLPGILFWLYRGQLWQSSRPFKQRILYGFLIMAVSVGWYGISGQIAEAIALPNDNVSILWGLLFWWRDRFSGGAFLEHLLRLVIPYVLPTSLLLTVVLSRPQLWKQFNRSEVWACWLMVLGIIAQPFLAGPEITGQNASRLAALGLIPLLVSLAFWLTSGIRKTGYICQNRTGAKVVLGLSIGIASFHHLYTFIGPPTALTFALLQIGLAITASLSLSRLLQSVSKTAA